MMRKSETQQVVQLARPWTVNKVLTQAMQFDAVADQDQVVRDQVQVRAATTDPSEKPCSVEELAQKIIDVFETTRV